MVKRPQARVWAACDTPNPDEARFCFSCGVAFASQVAARQERKFATVLFADLVGSTSLAEREDPEIVRTIVGRLFVRFANEIERYGGTVEKFLGDGVLAVFGIPAAHEDDPERAVRAAVAMQQIVEDVNRGLATEGRADVSVRIGIEAGDVLFDVTESELRDRMLTGDVVNTAARLQTAAEPGHIVVGSEIHAATNNVVELRPLPPLTLKGKARPVAAWEVAGVATRAGERPQPGLRARLIGRDAQLAILSQTFAGVAASSEPRFLTILGSAGVGKSRLVREFEWLVEQRHGPSALRKGRCLAYGNISYSALADVVKTEGGILEDDTPGDATTKIRRLVGDLFDSDELSPHIESLAGAGVARQLPREELFEAWRRLLERMAARSPVLLVLEDVHWADDGLLDFLEHLSAWAQGPLMVVALARPELLERRPEWGDTSPRRFAITLDPLTPDETATMLADLLSTPVEDDLIRLIVDRSEGNPLCGEEIVRMLVDRGDIRADQSGWKIVTPVEKLKVPRSISSLLASRIDALSGEEKTVLQSGAVLGRIFWVGAVARLAGRTVPEVTGLVGRLCEKDILVAREAAVFSGEQEVAFRHVLIRDVAYESLPKSFRAVKHAEAARWAEERAGDRREEIAEVLATHYVEGVRYLDELGEADGARGELERHGFQWTRAAGQRAARLWQKREAARWYRHALELGERTRATNDEMAVAWEAYAHACEGVEPYDEVARALTTALTLFDAIGRLADSGRVQAWMAFVAFQSGRGDEVLERAQAALDRLEPLGESADLAQALVILGWHQRRLGRAGDAEPYLRRAVEMARRVGDSVVTARAMASLGRALYQAGKADEGVSVLEKALGLARDAGDLTQLLRAHVDLSEAHEEATGDYRRAEALLRDGLEIARKAGHVQQIAWMEANLSDCLFDIGRLDSEVERLARSGLEAARAVGEAPRIAYCVNAIAMRHAIRGNLEEARRTIDETRAISGNLGDPYMEALVTHVDGLIALGRGRLEEAADVLAAGARRLGDRVLVWGGQNMLAECVRTLALAGRAGEAREFRDRLAALAAWSVPARAFCAWADGLLEADATKAREILADAAAQFESLGRLIELGRCLGDVARAERRLGEDVAATVARSRELLESCGARLFVAENV